MPEGAPARAIAHFELHELLGKGGQGEVYRAVDRQLGRVVALKVLRGEATTQPDDSSLLAEARRQAAFQHPNLPTVFEVGQHEGQCYLAMEYVNGEALSDRLASGPLAVGEALTITRQIAAVLEAIHSQGWIHGDLSPANVILRPDGSLKLLDLGLAHPAARLEPGDESETATPIVDLGRLPYAGRTSFGGTAGFLPPEVLCNGVAGEPGDLFALGVMLYQMLSGRLPFDREKLSATFSAVLHEEPPPLSRDRAEVDLELERVVRRALEKNPSRRYSSAAEMRADLDFLVLRRDIRSTQHGARIATVPDETVGKAALERKSHTRSPDLSPAGFTTRWPFLRRLQGFLRRNGRGHATDAEAAGNRAFQGLLPFTERDRDRFFGRRTEIENLLEMVLAAELRFGVLAGESGCGKSSLLHAGLIPRLWENGLFPVCCRAFSDVLAAIVGEAQRRSQIPRLQDESVLAYLGRLAQDLDTTVVIAIDQFEEFFLNFPSEAEREPFLCFIAAVARDPLSRIKLLLIIRSDFLHLVSSELTGRVPDPLAARQLFHLRNFPESRAEEILRLTTTQAGLNLEPAFAAYLARDLSIGRLILPSELQIVGEQLQKHRILTIADYRRAGGKEELVNGFLTDVIQLSGDARRATRLLHALISEENTRQTLTLDEIAGRSNLDGKTLEWMLRIFVQGRLVREIQEGSPWRYELVHEYLIGPIHRTTGKVMDERQRAARLLRQFLTNFQGDPRTRIPMGKLLFLYRYADEARRGSGLELMRKSLWRAGWQAGLGGTLALATALVISGWLSVTETWEPLALQDGHASAALHVSISPDGFRLATGSDDGTVIVWDFAQRRRLATFKDHSSQVWSVVFSTCGRYLASGGGDQRVVVRDARSLAPLAVLDSGGPVVQVAFHQDKGMLLAFGAQETRGWSLRDWRLEFRAPALFGGYGNVVNLPSHELYCSSGTVLRFKEQPTLTTASKPGGNWCALAPDGTRLASIDNFGILRAWRLGSKDYLLEEKAHHDHGRAVAFSSDGTWLASGAENIVLWDARTLTRVCRLDFPSIVWNLAFSPDSRWLVSTHGDGAVLVWDLRERSLAARMDRHCGPVRTVAFSANGRRIASAGDDHSILVWEVGSPLRKVATLLGHATRVNGVAFHPDGSRLFSCDQAGRLFRWNLDNFDEAPTLIYQAEFNHPLYALELIENGQYVVVHGKVLDSATGRLLRDLGPSIGNSPAHYDYSWCARTHLLAGARAVVSPDIALWEIDATAWRQVETWSSPQTGWICLGLAADGRTLATGNDTGEVWWWQSQPLKQIALLGKHAARIKTVAFSPDGRHVASAGDDCTIRLWDIRNRNRMTQIDTHTAPILSLAFSPDGKKLISGEHDHSVRLYSLHRSLWGWRLD